MYCEVFITNVDILEFFVINVHLDEAGPTTFLPTFCFYSANYENLNIFLDLYAIDLNNQGQNTTTFSHETRREKPEGVLLSQLHFKLPAKFKLGGTTSRLAPWPLNTCFKMATADAEILGFFGDSFLGIAWTLEAETSVSDLTQYKLFIGDDKKNTLFGVTFSFNWDWKKPHKPGA